MSEEELDAMESVWLYLSEMTAAYLDEAAKALEVKNYLQADKAMIAAAFWGDSFESYNKYFKEMKKLYGR